MIPWPRALVTVAPQHIACQTQVRGLLNSPPTSPLKVVRVLVVAGIMLRCCSLLLALASFARGEIAGDLITTLPGYVEADGTWVNILLNIYIY